jgi:hypothetical protein
MALLKKKHNKPVAVETKTNETTASAPNSPTTTKVASPSGEQDDVL